MSPSVLVTEVTGSTNILKKLRKRNPNVRIAVALPELLGNSRDGTRIHFAVKSLAKLKVDSVSVPFSDAHYNFPDVLQRLKNILQLFGMSLTMTIEDRYIFNSDRIMDALNVVDAIILKPRSAPRAMTNDPDLESIFSDAVNFTSIMLFNGFPAEKLIVAVASSRQSAITTPFYSPLNDHFDGQFDARPTFPIYSDSHTMYESPGDLTKTANQLRSQLCDKPTVTNWYSTTLNSGQVLWTSSYNNTNFHLIMGPTVGQQLETLRRLGVMGIMVNDLPYKREENPVCSAQRNSVIEYISMVNNGVQGQSLFARLFLMRNDLVMDGNLSLKELLSLLTNEDRDEGVRDIISGVQDLLRAVVIRDDEFGKLFVFSLVEEFQQFGQYFNYDHVAEVPKLLLTFKNSVVQEEAGKLSADQLMMIEIIAYGTLGSVYLEEGTVIPNMLIFPGILHLAPVPVMVTWDERRELGTMEPGHIGESFRERPLETMPVEIPHIRDDATEIPIHFTNLSLFNYTGPYVIIEWSNASDPSTNETTIDILNLPSINSTGPYVN